MYVIVKILKYKIQWNMIGRLKCEFDEINKVAVINKRFQEFLDVWFQSYYKLLVKSISVWLIHLDLKS